MSQQSGSCDPAQSAEAMDQFRNIVTQELLETLQPVGCNAVYTPLLTVWLLVYQRLFDNCTLQSAVTEFLKMASKVSTNKRVLDNTLSPNTAAYSRARTRLGLATANSVADHVFTSLLGSLASRRTFLLDGTTLSLSSNAVLRQQWPPGSNQYGPGNWPISHLVVAHDLDTGMAVRPEVGAMYGPAADSELSLSLRLLPRIPANSILMADRNFGVFSFVHAAAGSGHDVLVRLTEVRFKSLIRSAQPIAAGLWRLQWTPSKHDRKTNPSLAPDALVTVYLHEFVGFSKKTLWVATTLTADVSVLAGLYARRWEIETDIKHLKKTMQIDALRGQSPEMVLKEIAIATVAYNLVLQVRRLAAERAKVPPKRISFSGVWDLVRIILFAPNEWTDAEWEQWFERVIRDAGRRKLPNRPGRSYARQIIPRGRKFPERKRSPPATEAK
jgi:hypothetical protein